MRKKLLERIFFVLYFLGFPVKWIEVELAKVRCPKCGKEAKCFHRISSETSAYDYFILECAGCGHTEEKSELVTFCESTNCPYCDKPHYDHRKSLKGIPNRSHHKAS